MVGASAAHTSRTSAWRSRITLSLLLLLHASAGIMELMKLPVFCKDIVPDHFLHHSFWFWGSQIVELIGEHLGYFEGL